VSTLGLGVMLASLGDRSDTVTAVRGALGKRIAKAEVMPTKTCLRIAFEDGTRLRLWDGGQSCCESRYMTCDDDLPYYMGAELLDVEVKDGPKANGDDGYGDHDQQFLVVTTSKGAFTVANHNEHNGYYGGFAIEASLAGSEAEK